MAGGSQPSKFWTRVHRTFRSRIAMVLVYAVLEWILIFFLLLHAFFSYLLTSFASHFSLRPPCVLCSRIDHLFDSAHRRPSYHDLVCSSHLAEISAEGHGRESPAEESSSDEGPAPRCACCGGAPEAGLGDSLEDLAGTQIGDGAVESVETGKVESCDVGALEEPENHGADLTTCEALDVDEQKKGLVHDSDQKETEGAKYVISGIQDSSFVETTDHVDGDEEISCRNCENLPEIVQLQLETAEHTHVAEEVEQCSSNPSLKDESIDSKEVDTEADSSSLAKSNNAYVEEPTTHLEIEEAPSVQVCQLSSSVAITSPGSAKEGRGIVIDTQVTVDLGANEMENEKALGTPMSMDSVYLFHKSFISGSVDGSEANDTDEVEQLKSALKAERQALSTLYAELEEERSASAIAANHTMAMISRLQEEKAQMQMEALQYQRLVEEQSEHDQEEVQILNELLTKREMENQYLESELEIYREKVLFYEEKERQSIRGVRVTEGGYASESASVDGGDGLSNSLDASEGNLHGHAHGNAIGLNNGKVRIEKESKGSAKQPGLLDESLKYFEMERLSILDQLKELEEKLFSVSGNKRLPKDMQHIDHPMEEKGALAYSDNGFLPNSFSDTKHPISRQKIHLDGNSPHSPFKSISIDDEDESHSRDDELHPELQRTKISIEEELESVYDRLHALETDSELLRHSVNSLKNGDKGMDLLQQVLEHFRVRRSNEPQEKNSHEEILCG